VEKAVKIIFLRDMHAWNGFDSALRLFHTCSDGDTRTVLRGRPPFFPMALNCSFVSLAARALPPNRANSETVSTFFIRQVYHCGQASRRALFHIGVLRPVMIGIHHSFPRPMRPA
jgi:hypothetical protein